MAETVVLRSTFGKYLTISVIVVVVACLVALGVQGEVAVAVRFVAPLVTLGYLVWLVYWAPAVEVSDGGVRLVNVFRTIDLPWPAIERIDTKYALTLFTTYGRFVAWAAPSAGRHRFISTPREDARGLPESFFIAGTLGQGDLPNTESGDAAAVVRSRWESLRDGGHLDSGLLDDTIRPVAWNPVKIATTAVLVAASLTSLLAFSGR
ncbi:PH domain-containing protein [Lacisediminihabitans sp.]|uniref:PH domain-containing protein n=1 Tax=Lacisediminihabitans sp. TaxID=2787631 RepID=UPI00374D645F